MRVERRKERCLAKLVADYMKVEEEEARKKRQNW